MLGVVVIVGLLGAAGVERLGVTCAREDVAGAATLVGDWLGLGELGRLGAGWLL
jgi:hypothetical protein